MKSAKIDVRFTPQEKGHLASMAKQAHISTGELVRRLSTGATLPAYGKYEAIKEVSKVGSDLARLGNLFKLSINQLSEALNDERADSATLEALIEELTRNRREVMNGHRILQDKIGKL